MVRTIIPTNGESEYLPKTLVGLSKQSKKPDEIIIVNTSKENHQENILKMVGKCGINIKIVKYFHFPKIKNISRAINRVLVKELQISDDDYIWILHDDSAPHKKVLELLFKRISNSSNIGIVGPKQVDFTNYKNIKEAGIKTTNSGKRVDEIFVSEYDQGQYDYKTDVLGVGTAGMLFKFDVFKMINGFDNALGPFFEGLDFSIRARLKAQRVVLIPDARLEHVTQSNVDNSKTFFEKTRSQNYYSLLHSRFFIVEFIKQFFSLFVKLLKHILNKKLSRCFLELGAFFKQNFTRIVYRRRKIRHKSPVSYKELLPLMWSKFDAKELLNDEKLSKVKIRVRNNFEIKEQKEFVQKRRKTFYILLSVITALTICLMRKIISSGPFISGGALGSYSKGIFQSWTEYLSPWQSIGQGFPGPKNPIALLMTIFNTISLGRGAVCLFLFYILSPIILFISAWLFISATGAPLKARVIYSLLFFSFPLFWISIFQGRIGAVITYSFINFFAYAIVRLLGLHQDFRKFEFPFDVRQGSTMFAGIAGLCLMLVSMGTPIILFVTFFSSIFFIKRIKSYLILIFLPSVALFFPTWINLLHNPLPIFAEPGVQFINDVFPSLNSSLYEKIFFATILFGLVILFILSIISATKTNRAIFGLFVALLCLVVTFLSRYIVIEGIELTFFGISTLLAFGFLYASIQNFKDKKQPFLYIGVFCVVLSFLFSCFYSSENLNLIHKTKRYSKIIDISNKSSNSVKTIVLNPGKDSMKYSIVRSSEVQIDDFSQMNYNVSNKHFENAVADILNSDISTLKTDGIGYIIMLKNRNINNVDQNIDNALTVNKIIENDNYILWTLDNQARLFVEDNNSIIPISAKSSLPIKVNVPAGGQNRKIILTESYSAHWQAYYNGQKLSADKYGWKTSFNIPAQDGKLVIKYNDPLEFLIYLQLLILALSVIISLPIRKVYKYQ